MLKVFLSIICFKWSSIFQMFKNRHISSIICFATSKPHTSKYHNIGIPMKYDLWISIPSHHWNLEIISQLSIVICPLLCHSTYTWLYLSTPLHIKKMQNLSLLFVIATLGSWTMIYGFMILNQRLPVLKWVMLLDSTKLMWYH